MRTAPASAFPGPGPQTKDIVLNTFSPASRGERTAPPAEVPSVRLVVPGLPTGTSSRLPAAPALAHARDGSEDAAGSNPTRRRRKRSRNRNGRGPGTTPQPPAPRAEAPAAFAREQNRESNRAPERACSGEDVRRRPRDGDKGHRDRDKGHRDRARSERPRQEPARGTRTRSRGGEREGSDRVLRLALVERAAAVISDRDSPFDRRETLDFLLNQCRLTMDEFNAAERLSRRRDGGSNRRSGESRGRGDGRGRARTGSRTGQRMGSGAGSGRRANANANAVAGGAMRRDDRRKEQGHERSGQARSAGPKSAMQRNESRKPKTSRSEPRTPGAGQGPQGTASGVARTSQTAQLASAIANERRGSRERLGGSAGEDRAKGADGSARAEGSAPSRRKRRGRGPR